MRPHITTKRLSSTWSLSGASSKHCKARFTRARAQRIETLKGRKSWMKRRRDVKQKAINLAHNRTRVCVAFLSLIWRIIAARDSKVETLCTSYFYLLATIPTRILSLRLFYRNGNEIVVITAGRSEGTVGNIAYKVKDNISKIIRSWSFVHRKLFRLLLWILSVS